MCSPSISTRVSNRPLEEFALSMKKESGVGMGSPREAYAVQKFSKLPSTSRPMFQVLTINFNAIFTYPLKLEVQTRLHSVLVASPSYLHVFGHLTQN